MVWTGEKMDEYHMTRRVLMGEVSGWRGQDRSRLIWSDGWMM